MKHPVQSMNKKPLFDQKESQILFDSLQKGLDEILLLRAQVGSKDPKEKKQALERLHQIFEGVKEAYEKMPEELKKKIPEMKKMFQDTDNFTDEQKKIKAQLEQKMRLVTSKKIESPVKTASKVKKGKRRWVKS